MKRIITSASLAALGAVGLHADADSGVTQSEGAKPWSISASLRGFYDDNYATLPAHAPAGTLLPTARSSFGFQFSPHAGVNYRMGTTMLTADYIYGLTYYADRINNDADHSHQINLGLTHGFSENYKLSLSDSFVVAQEPEILDPANIATGLKLRANGNNIRNNAAARLDAEFTRQFGAQIGYVNNVYAYDNKGAGSYSALLDRMEHLATLDGHWNVTDSTQGILGYQYGEVDYSAPDLIGGAPSTAVGPARFRNDRSHYGYAGIKQNFTTQLVASARVGAQYTEYPNVGLYSNPVSPTDKLASHSWSPYADAYASYNYTQNSQVLLGVRHSLVATDVLALNEEATTVYATWTHALTAKVSASLLGNAQFGTFHDNVTFNSKRENYYSVGINVAYQINQFLAAETGYSFDRLDSEVQYLPGYPRSFSRNRVYLGLRASY